MKLNELVVHPFIFAILPVVLTLAQVKTEILPEETPPIFLLMELVTALIFCTCWLCLRPWRRDPQGTQSGLSEFSERTKMAGAFTSLAVTLLFCYLSIASTLDAGMQSLTGQKSPVWLDLLIYAILSAAGLSATLKRQWSFGKGKLQTDYASLNNVLNIVSCIILLMDVTPLLLFQLHVRDLAKDLATDLHSQVSIGKLQCEGQPPDVYYMVCDGFPNEHTLKDTLSTEPQFADFLRSKKFCVADKSFSNYDRTESSLCSSLNMQYLDGLMQRLSKEPELAGYEEEIIVQNSLVLKSFRDLGYRIINVGAELGPTYWMPTATANYKRTGLNHFAAAILLLTPALAIESYIPIMRDDLAEARLYPGTVLSEIAQTPGPKFVLIHTTLAHAPDIFTESGQRLPLPPGLQTNWGTSAEYVSQLKFAQQNFEAWISTILEKSKTPPVIIVQSDHGPGLTVETPQEKKNMRMRILNAYFLPGKKCQGIYESVSPVNTFRILFNDYFSAKLKLLPDHANWAPVYEHPLDLKDVSQDLTF